MQTNNANSRGAARRFLPLVAVSVFFLAGFVAFWATDWIKLQPIPTTGGLYFPWQVVIEGPHFSQGDERWANDRLGATEESLAEAGCAVASSAMALGALRVSTDPGKLNAFLQQTPGGYTQEGWIYWEKAAEIDPARTNNLLPHYEDLPSFFLIDWNLLKGNPVIARVRYPNGITHFVLVCGKEGYEYLVRDPGEGGRDGLRRLSVFPGPVEALRFYRKPARLDGERSGA
jgi:hypothetical protein